MATAQTIKHVGLPEPEIDDAWVMQVIAEAQEEQRQNPMTPDELVAEFRELSRYGGERARELGIKEEDIDRMIHEHRQQTTSTNRA